MSVILWWQWGSGGTAAYGEKVVATHYIYIMAKKRYYYRFAMTSGLGVRFRGFWNECQRATKAAERFAKKVGAKFFWPDTKMVAGGVDWVVFPEGAKVDTRIWKMDGKDDDGEVLWVPDVKKRRGVCVVPVGGKVPAHTANRIFDRKAKGDGGAAAYGEGDNGGRDESGGTRWGYTEIYRDDDAARSEDKRYKMSRAAKESIRIEKERLLLPRIGVADLLRVLKADVMADVPMDDRLHAVQIFTPDMFEWKGSYYMSIDYPCRDEEMEEIKQETYRLANTERMMTERAVKEMEKMGES